VLLVGAVLARHALVGALLVRAFALATGDDVRIGNFRIDAGRSVFTDVRVATPSGDPLFAAAKVTLDISLRGLLTDRLHRYGLSAVALDAPVFSIVRHRDASYSIGRGSGGAAEPAPPPAGIPWNATLRVRDGEVRLVDRAPVAPDLGLQRIVGVQLDASIQSVRRSTATGSARYLARETAHAPLRSWPIALGADVDYPRGVAIVRIDAPQVPLRGPIGYVQHSTAVRVDDGLADRVALTIFALDIGLARPLELHVGGDAYVHTGTLAIGSLRHPARDVRGRIILTDDGVWTRRLAGSIAGIPVIARGGAFNRLHPTIRIGVRGDADLSRLRRLFGFSENAPVAGAAHVETLLEAPTANLVVRSVLRVRHGTYGKIPVDDIRGRIDYHAGSVLLEGVRGRYGSASVAVGARFVLGGPALDSAIVASATAAGNTIPYAENLAPESTVDALALITGGPAGFRARGSVGVRGADIEGRGAFAVDERGAGEFGPLTLERTDGSSLVGALRLERAISRSAAWVSANRYRVDVPPRAARFAGISVPAFPPLAGVVDGRIAGGGPPDAFALAGALSGHRLRVGTIALGTGRAALSGTFADLRLGRLDVDGPLGRFSGSGAALRGALALRGAYAGSLERLVPLTGDQAAHGAVRGSVRATLRGTDVVVQSTDALLNGGSVRGVELEAAAGTIAVRAGHFHLIAASGSVRGRGAVAAESHDRIAVSAPDIPSAALRGTGLPLDSGNVSAYGIADVRGTAPAFDGTVVVADGRARGYPVAGDARIDVAGPRARIVSATGAFGSTYGSIGGSLDGIGRRVIAYDVDTRVPLGDIDVVRRDLGIPVRHLAGTFAAKLHVHGAGNLPRVDGRVDVAEGSYNGLAFRAAGARIELGPGQIAARDGSLTVGSTRAAITASLVGGAFALDVRSPAADLTDFNDFFDASDTLGGRGNFDLTVRSGAGLVAAGGALNFTGLRVRRFALGSATARWSTRGRAISGTADVRSPAGNMRGVATVVPGPGSPAQAFGLAEYDARAAFAGIDLASWVPASGSSLPVLGKLNANVAVSGRLARLAVTTDATLADAEIDGLAVGHAHVRARSVGSRIDVVAADADLGFIRLSGSGRLGLADSDGLDFDLRAASDDVGRAARLFAPATRGRDLAGKLDADLRLTGTRGAPKAAGGFDVRDARYGNLRVPRTAGEVALTRGAIELRNADVELAHGQAFLAASVPFMLQPFRLGPPRGPVSLDVTARNVDLGQFASLLPTGTALGGIVDGRFGLAGTVERPRLFGALSVSDGSYTSVFERAPIQHVEANVALEGNVVSLERFHAGVGGGSLDGSGRIALPIGARPSVAYRATLDARAARLDFPAFGRGTIDGELQLASGGARPLVAGEVTVRDAVVPVSAVYGNGAAAGVAAGASLPIDPRFNIHAVAGDNVRLRSATVDIGVSGAVDVSGSLHAPLLAGGFSATDGTLSSYNHVFKIQNATVTFDPADGPVPTIAARAVARVVNPDPDPSRNIAGSATIIVTVSGTADSNNLQVTYSSEPAYSQAQIVGLLLDVPALLGAVNFNLNDGPGGPLLRGAPGETNALLPPGVTPEQVSAISFNEEVFSLLNGQLTQRALSPIERSFERFLGLADVEFTVDYGGGIGYSVRRQIGKRDFYAFLNQTVSYPERSNLGFELVPKPFQSINFSYYQQNGITSLITNATPGEELFSSTRRLTSVQPLGNRSGLSLNFSRRF
jgi:hypothetical protein